MQRLSIIITNTDNFDVSASGRTFPTRKQNFGTTDSHEESKHSRHDHKLRISSVDIFSKIPIRYYTELHIGEATPFQKSVKVYLSLFKSYQRSVKF